MKEPVYPKKPANVLMVDDTPANLELLSGMLKGRGYRVRAAVSGELALRAIRNDPPDLILLDITMPEMNGYEVCAKLKADENLKENSPFTKLQGDLERVRYYFNAARNIGAFLLAVGLALYLLGLGVISGLKHALFSGAVASVFNYLFYKFALMGIVNSMIKDALPDGLGGILGIMKIWINSSVSETISFIMIVGVISIASMIIFLVIKKK